MSLDLAPETETLVREFAAREGLSASDYVTRLVKSAEPSPPAPHPDNPVAQWLAAQLEEAANATPEEREEAEREWRAFTQGMNANRRVTGERLL